MRDKSGNQMNNEIAAELQARIADLEAKNTALEARLAKLEPKPLAPKPRVEESIVRVAELIEPGEFVMPNSTELKRLRDIVHARYPQLAGEFTGKFAADDARAHEQGFAAAFRRLGHMRRLPDGDLDAGRSSGWWVDEAEQWLRQHGGGDGRVPLLAWLAAIVAHHDIAFTLPDPKRGFVSVSVGLVAVGTGAWRPPANAWRALLDGARVREPEEQKHAREVAGPQRMNVNEPQPLVGRQNRAVTW